ncbi:MAG: glutamate-5-semialdehyde dehydrogenase [Firmicutes bacterium]|nr:glutamate-5-semialdehyde dehydrogenase [Bacillota bacterium]
MLKEIIEEQCKLGKNASYELASVSINIRNEALHEMADALRNNVDLILAENALDMENGKVDGLSQSLIDRLMLNADRIEAMACGLESLSKLDDPIGQTKRMWQRPNGLEIGAMSVPLGLIAMVYEARPNVTVEAAGLCVKTGNAVILKGSSTAYNSNKILAALLNEGALKAGLPSYAVQIIDSKDRESVNVLMKLNKYVDVIIPRGGAGLISNVVNNSTVPVIETGIGNCHAYVDDKAQFYMALDIIVNGKTQRPSVCNSLEKVLVHKDIAEEFLPLLELKLIENTVEIRACENSMKILKSGWPITEEELYTEYLDYIIGIIIVNDVNDAVKHINKYGSKHSEVIISDSYKNGKIFQQLIDSACIYHNASTRFSDGEMFGFGAEIGISTQKMHTRGPMGLEALTSIKYIINGDGQVR